MPDPLRFDFPAPVLKDESNPRWTFHYVPIPPDVADELLQHKARRVVLTVNGETAKRYVYQHRDGEFRVIIGLATLRQLGHKPGDVMLVSIEPDPDPDAVKVPEELVEALTEYPEAQRRFEEWTQGKKRSLVSYITQAK
jgi:hypothetical protein